MPFMKRETMGWLPILTLSLGRMIADRALLAVFMVVYDDPCSCTLTRKSSTEFKGGLYELTFHLEQNSCHFLIYGAYCFCVPVDQDCWMMLVALLEIALCWKDSLILCKPLIATVCWEEDKLHCCGAGTEDCPSGEVLTGCLSEGSREA